MSDHSNEWLQLSILALLLSNLLLTIRLAGALSVGATPPVHIALLMSGFAALCFIKWSFGELIMNTAARFGLLRGEANA